MLLRNRPEFRNIFLSLLGVDLFVASSISKMAEKFNKTCKSQFNKACKSLVFNNYWNVLHNQLYRFKEIKIANRHVHV